VASVTRRRPLTSIRHRRLNRTASGPSIPWYFTRPSTGVSNQSLEKHPAKPSMICLTYGCHKEQSAYAT
jgi:hypothetical protein